MQYVRALCEADWLEVPINIERPAEPDPHAPELPKFARTLVMALEHGVWKVNNSELGVYVYPHLVLGFNDVVDANFLLAYENRASRVHVVPGQVVLFHNDEDALHFVALGQAERISEEEAKQLAESKATHARAANVVTIATPAKASKRTGVGR
jgi:hypothetical protein